MLGDMTFWTEDKVWRGILSDLGATFGGAETADLIFVPEKYSGKLSPSELKSRMTADIDESRARAVRAACGRDAAVSPAQAKIVALLHRAGGNGMSVDALRAAHGYSSGTTTHALDTAVYNLRKTFGADFIRTENGKYFIRGHVI